MRDWFLMAYEDAEIVRVSGKFQARTDIVYGGGIITVTGKPHSTIAETLNSLCTELGRIHRQIPEKIDYVHELHAEAKEEDI